jgi:hypothetical protein
MVTPLHRHHDGAVGGDGDTSAEGEGLGCRWRHAHHNVLCVSVAGYRDWIQIPEQITTDQVPDKAHTTHTHTFIYIYYHHTL